MTVENFTGASAEKINEEIKILLRSKPNIVIVHAGANDLTNEMKLLKSFKKVLKKYNKI